jgi:hypothetical protein
MSPDISAPAGQNKKPVLDFESEGQKEKTQMAIAGLLVVLSLAFVSYMIGFILFVNDIMALVFAFSMMLIYMGTLWYLSVLIQQATRKVKISIIEERTP